MTTIDSDLAPPDDDDDTFQLQQFDSTLPPNGNWKSLGALQNISS